MKEPPNKSKGILYSSLGFVIFFDRLINFIIYKDDMSTLQFDFLILFLSIMLLVSSFTIFTKYVNFCGLWIIALITFYNGYNSWYSVSLTFIIAIIAFKYIVMKKSLIFKTLSSLLIFISICVLIYTFFYNKIQLVTIILPLVFFLITMTIIFYMFSNEYKNFKCKEKIYKEDLKVSEIKYKDIKNYLEKIDINYIDPVKAGLTKTELSLLENLCLYKESNAYLAKRLGKSPNTVKVQLPKIMTKIGVENRYQLIDQCKYYFLNTKNVKKS